jgi:hypothetical protein
MRELTPWPWHESLGGLKAETVESYRIRRILFGMVKDRCSELGLTEGETFRCMDRDRDGVEIQLSCGTVRKLDLPYAWFVEVEPVREPLAADQDASPVATGLHPYPRTTMRRRAGRGG